MRNNRFYPTFWTQLLGALNDNIFKNALVILLTFKLASTQSANLVILAGGLFVLPFFLFSAFAGELSDKYPKNKLSQYLKLLELVIVIIGAGGFLLHSLPILFTCLFLLGLQSALYGPIKYSILPELLPETSLVKANAFVEMGTFLAILIGTIFGGVFINLSSGESIVGYSCIVLALMGYLVSFKIPSLEPIKKDHIVSWNIWKLNKSNFKLVYPQKNIFLTILGISWFWFLGACLLSLFPLIVKDHLHGQESLVTILLAIFSIGIAFGSLACEMISKKSLELGLVPLGSIGMFVFLIDLVLSLSNYSYRGAPLTAPQFIEQGQSVRILIDLFLFSVFSGFYTVPLYSYLQIRTKREERSRIVAFNNILNSVFMVMGALFLAITTSLLTLPQIILSLAIMTFLVSAYVYFFMPEFLWRLVCFFISHVIYKFKSYNIPTYSPEDRVVLTVNHVSFIDWLLVASSINRPVRFVIYHKIYNNPFLNPLFKASKAIPIASLKENSQVYDEAFKEITKAIDNQEIVCIFPEGKISPDGSIQTYKSGIEKIVKNNNVSVQNLALKGMNESFFAKRNGKAFTSPLLLIKRFRAKVELHALSKHDHLITAKDLENEARDFVENK